MNENLKTAAEIIQLLAAVEPAAIGLVKSFLEKLQGKTVEQITAEADSIWDQVIANAKREQGGS